MCPAHPVVASVSNEPFISDGWAFVLMVKFFGI